MRERAAQELSPKMGRMGAEDPATGPSAGPRISTPVFEGPLELLLALAEREEVDIFQVPLARITDAYLAEIAQREWQDPHRGVAAEEGLGPAAALAGGSSPLLEEMAEFLWMAARLLLLKSIRLLPGEQPTDEETELLGWEEDVRQRLEEYRAYKAMAQDLMTRAEQEVFAFPPAARPVEAGGQEEPLDVDVLVAAFNSVLARIPPRPVVITGRTWTLEEKLDLITKRLRQGPIELLGLILESEDRLEAVVTFVAVLELVRRSAITVRQKERFGPIHIEARAA